ncbi:MAG: aspartate-semialdehyde dehydrogenase [Planctomycetales bacterium]|nr:aspartate-semialdehyde dehydrogenase [Planctomycetales bacterium]
MAGKGYRVAIVGATGAVGQEFLAVLEQRKFPVRDLRLFASARSAGRKVRFAGAEVSVEEAGPGVFRGIELALFSAGASVSRTLGPAARDAGALVVDNSSAFRMDPEVPLVVPEVNPEALAEAKGLVANPNCTTIMLVVPLAPLHRAVRCREVVLSSYQAVSGTGAKAIAELEAQVRAWAGGKPAPAPSVYPKPIAFNVLPRVGSMDAGSGESEEERKVALETRKILGDPTIQVAATCVRVPVWRAHSESVTVFPEKPLDPPTARKLLAKAPGVRLLPEEDTWGPTPQEAAGQDDVLVGRIRTARADRPALSFFCAGDQLRKGAALNAVQIAERVLSGRP